LATNSETDKRLFQLIRSWKEGKEWTGFDGQRRDQCTYILDRVGADLLSCPSLAPGRVLIPAPRSTRTTDPPASPDAWPGRKLVIALHQRTRSPGYLAFERTTERPQSSKAVKSGAARATIAEHRDSMRLLSFAAHPPPTPITIVDDVLTQGTQIAACATLLHRAGYTDVRACVAAYVLRDPADERAWNVRRVVTWEDHSVYASSA
jgi:hypothetical protein